MVELELLPPKLEEEKKRSTELQTKLDAALKDAQDVEKVVTAARKSVALKVVQKFMKSDFYCEDMQSRYNGRWTAAHRCSVKPLKLKEADWDKVEISYENRDHTTPTGLETQVFSDMVIQNADPRLLGDREIAESSYWNDVDSSA